MQNDNNEPVRASGVTAESLVMVLIAFVFHESAGEGCTDCIHEAQKLILRVTRASDKGAPIVFTKDERQLLAKALDVIVDLIVRGDGDGTLDVLFDTEESRVSIVQQAMNWAQLRDQIRSLA